MHIEERGKSRDAFSIKKEERQEAERWRGGGSVGK